MPSNKISIPGWVISIVLHCLALKKNNCLAPTPKSLKVLKHLKMLEKMRT